MLDGISVSVRDFWFLVVSGDEEWIQIGPAMEKFPINVILRQHIDFKAQGGKDSFEIYVKEYRFHLGTSSKNT